MRKGFRTGYKSEEFTATGATNNLALSQGREAGETAQATGVSNEDDDQLGETKAEGEMTGTKKRR